MARPTSGSAGGGGGSLTDRLLGLARTVPSAAAVGRSSVAGWAVPRTSCRAISSVHRAGSRCYGEGVAELTGSSGFKLDDSGLAAQLGLEARVGTQVGLTGTLTSGWITQQLAGDVFLGALASAEGGLRLGESGLGLHGETEAFVGGRATGAYTLGTGPATGTIGGSVSYGLGVTAEGDVGFSWDNIGFSGRTGATLGLGVEADINISINPNAVIDGIGDALDHFGW